MTLTMNYLKLLRNLLIVSFSISIIGFIIDLGERVPNVWINIFEIIMMTGIIFTVFTSIYLLTKIITKIFQRIKMYT
jgi:hypothetical protein